jgi:RNA polymerase sigma factor (sigma-70 family)
LSPKVASRIRAIWFHGDQLKIHAGFCTCEIIDSTRAFLQLRDIRWIASPTAGFSLAYWVTDVLTAEKPHKRKQNSAGTFANSTSNVAGSGPGTGVFVTAFAVDKSAWTKLLRKITRKTNNSCDAEDFLQSAYLRLAHYQTTHEVKDSSAFLVSVATNIGIDNFRHQRLAIGGAERLEIGDDAPLQDEVIAARVRLERVKEGLSRLPAQTREILLMRRLDGRGYDEIAAHLGVSRSTVERTIARATAFLIEWTIGW